MAADGRTLPAIQRLAALAVARIERRLRDATPALATPTLAWMRALAGDTRPECYFLHPAAFPMLQLPWWMEASIHGSPSRPFQADVAYSTISGYYAIRMIDDLMDGDAGPDPRILPALLVLYAESEGTYHGYFDTDDPFWDLWRTATDTGAEAAAQDAALDGITRGQFIETCARKTAGATAPLAAVACRYGRHDAFRRWSGLVDRFGRWHQMLNDIHDWARDLERGRTSYFLSEAERRSPGAAGGWILREGLAWGRAELDAWMADVTMDAAALGSLPLDAYVVRRRTELDEEWRRLTATLATLPTRAAPAANPRLARE